MTYIEFFEKDVLKNLCACLMAAPDKIILVGDGSKEMKRHAERYERLLRARREIVEFAYVTVNSNNLPAAVEALERIVEEEGDCAFDLNGGDDVCLVAIGIVSERLRDRHIQLHRFNIRSNTLYDCDLDGNTIIGEAPRLSVEELIYAFGGDIVEELVGDEEPFSWDWSEEFEEQVAQLWEISSGYVWEWNLQADMLGMLEAFAGVDPNRLTTDVPTPYFKDYLSQQDRTVFMHAGILKKLVAAGFLTRLEYDEDRLSVTYRDARIKRCLTKAGQVLELYVCAAARKAVDADGTPTYQDVMTGVTIDWDGIRGDSKVPDTANEVDVILMHGMVPVFISCKNGSVDSNELYKLNTVAARFGGTYARKVLIAAALDPEDLSVQHLIQRGKDMGIRVIPDSFKMLTPEKLNRLMRSLWCNS